jgi:sulfatase maturation enzyme AslB (radical SAM superfamily)
MDCEYCYQRESRKKLREKNEIKSDSLKSIYKLMDNNLNNIKNDNSIVLFGGEPLLCLDKIRKVVQYNKERCNNYYFFSMTTNGLLLNNKATYDIITDYAKNYRFRLEVSYDKSGQYRRKINEKNSDDIIKLVLDKLNKDNVPFWISYTIHAGNYKSVIKDIIYLIEKYGNIDGIEIRFYNMEIEEITKDIIDNYKKYVYKYLPYIYKKYNKTICTADNILCSLCKKCNININQLIYLADSNVKKTTGEKENHLFSDF